MKKMFAFDPHPHAGAYAEEGYVYIPQGLNPDFLAVLVQQAEEYLAHHRLKDFAIGDKQQARYEFPEGSDCYNELKDVVAAVCGLDARDLLLSERHFKAYEASANPKPLAHKDRYASQISVGLSVRVPPGSTLVMYPHDELEVNPFNASTELRQSFLPDRTPELRLKHARRVEIQDRAGDVIIFRGHSIWHLREQPANTIMLYLKLNALNCDPLGEDANTPAWRQRTQELAALDDAELEGLVPVLGRKVDYFQRRYSRDWKELFGVVLRGEPHVTVDESEFRALQAVDGKRTVAAVIPGMGLDRTEALRRLRVLANRGIVDLVEKAEVSRNGHARRSGEVRVPALV